MPKIEKQKCSQCNEEKTLERFAVRTDQNRRLRKSCKDCTNKRINSLRAGYRKQVFDHYGWICVCCGENEPKFMTIDHIYNDGYLDKMKYGRKRKLISKDLYYKIIFVEKFPVNRSQSLCHNCQFGKWDGRICPHQEKILLTGKNHENVKF